MSVGDHVEFRPLFHLMLGVEQVLFVGVDGVGFEGHIGGRHVCGFLTHRNSLIDAIGFGIVLPVLPDLVVTLGKVSLEQATRIAGYMLVAYSLTQFIAGPIMGNLSDRFGRRPVIIAGPLLTGCGVRSGGCEKSASISKMSA